jgi:hypothetical protein
MNQGVVMKKLMSFIGLLLPFVVQAAPVDGYKDLKFGMTLEQVKDSPLCESKWIYVKDINTWGCARFKFGDVYVTGGAMFIDSKLARVALKIPESHMVNTYLKLIEKYGEPDQSKQPEIIGETVRSDLLFADGTILYRNSIGSNKVIITHLIYTIQDFDDKNILGGGVSVDDL